MELKNDLTLLNNLWDLLLDSREGYIKAAERVDDHQVKAMLVRLSTGRLALLEELDALRLAADPEAGKGNGGTLKGDLHRAWIGSLSQQGAVQLTKDKMHRLCCTSRFDLPDGCFGAFQLLQ